MMLMMMRERKVGTKDIKMKIKFMEQIFFRYFIFLHQSFDMREAYEVFFVDSRTEILFLTIVVSFSPEIFHTSETLLFSLFWFEMMSED